MLTLIGTLDASTNGEVGRSWASGFAARNAGAGGSNARYHGCMERYFVYMLRCLDGTYYVGITNDVEKRVVQHQEGWDPSAYTHNRRPVALVYSAEFSEVTDAIAFEKQVKGWGRKKKEALIRGEYERLPGLAKKVFRKVCG